MHANHISPTWNKCVIGFSCKYGVNFNGPTRVAVWDLEHLSEMKFKGMNHPLGVKKYDNTETEVLPLIEYLFVYYNVGFHCSIQMLYK